MLESRTVTEYKFYVLVLNDMRSPKIEMEEPVLLADSAEAITATMESLREQWRDGQWGKSFRKGSVLEWYNPPYGGTGIQEFWADAPSLDEMASRLRYRGHEITIV